jgi:PilZ domain
MENLDESDERLHFRSTLERRKHLRNPCLIEAHCMVQGCGYKGTIQNISEGGACIRSVKLEKLIPGEEIVLVPRSRVLSDQLRGKIVWVGSNGIGVAFQTSELDSDESEDGLGNSGTFEMEYRKMGRIKQRRVRWEPSASADVSYRLYWSENGAINYDSDYADVGNSLQITLPDGIPSFPLVSGKIELGISAVSRAGNESEITKIVVPIDFTVPEPPTDLKLEDF